MSNGVEAAVEALSMGVMPESERLFSVLADALSKTAETHPAMGIPEYLGSAQQLALAHTVKSVRPILFFRTYSDENPA